MWVYPESEYSKKIIKKSLQDEQQTKQVAMIPNKIKKAKTKKNAEMIGNLLSMKSNKAEVQFFDGIPLFNYKIELTQIVEKMYKIMVPHTFKNIQK